MRNINKIIVCSSEKEYGNLNKLIHEHTSSLNEGGRGYRTVGFHYVINNGKAYKDEMYEFSVKDGHIEIGRPLMMANGCCKGHNIDSISICLIGKDKFTSAQVESLHNICEDLCEKFSIDKKEIYHIGELDMYSNRCSGNLPDLVKNVLKNNVA